MQPLDLRMFGVMKQNWKNAVKVYQDKHVGDYVTKECFSEVFKEAWETTTAQPSLAEEAFEAAGLIPRNPAKVLNNKKLEANQVFQQATTAATVPSTAAGVAPLADSQMTVCVHEYAGEQMADQDVPAPAHPATSGDLQRMAPARPGPSHLVITVPKQMMSTPLVAANKVSNAFEKVLVTPKAPGKKKTTRLTRKDDIPRAITGDAFRRLMEEEQRKKEEEAVL